MTDKEVKDTSEAREQKNAVFGNAPMVDSGGMPMMNRQEYAAKELAIQIPVDQVPLPSQGKVYPAEHPLHLQTAVSYRSMTAKEEDILMSQALIKKGTVITELIRSCLIDPRIDVSSLLSGDRNALMIAIRSSGYGRYYEPTHICPNCEFKNEMKVDLNALAIKPLSIDPVVIGTNEFDFVLPATGKRVLFRFLTGKEEEEIVAQAEMKKKKGLQSNTVVTTRLFYSIVEIDGNRDRSFINKFSTIMPAKDSRALRKFIDENEPGVDLTVDFNCSSCDYAESMVMPMTAAFFWI